MVPSAWMMRLVAAVPEAVAYADAPCSSEARTVSSESLLGLPSLEYCTSDDSETRGPVSRKSPINFQKEPHNVASS